MSFPNTAYKPGDRVWRLDLGKNGWVREELVVSVVWYEDCIKYRVKWEGTREFDMDDLFPTEEAAQQAADRLNKKG